MNPENPKEAEAMTKKIDSAQTKAAVSVLLTMAETIRELGSTPAGVLYAHMCGVISLEDFQRVVAILKGAELVTEKNHVLMWVGPAPIAKLAADVAAERVQS